ncbi:uncharacterized protein M6B38_132665 [Iris pallida]|uniref:Fungal lipase-type domain-containing protein n=1 Tax=Iris pallida TaxID=29817 RepID=A0AAX6FH82_IRIPA|nr:uncharacterized protein M6B38_132665 [Iris pallida]
MALNMDSFLRVRFLSGQRLPLAWPAAPDGVGLRNSCSKPCGRVALRPVRAAKVDTVTVEPPKTAPPTTVEEAPPEEELYMGSFSKYLDLNAEEAPLQDLVKFLADGKIGEVKSVRTPSGTVIDSPERRLAIVASLVLQKIILGVATPGVGTMTVMMNMLTQNNLSNLVWEFITGQMTFPDVNSQNFKSPFAFIDTRVQLDPSIKPSDGRYKAHICAMASKMSYENAERIRNTVRGYWNMEFIEFFNCWEAFQKEYTTQGFIMSDKPVESGEAELVVVAFRGTNDAYDAATDIDFSFFELPGVGAIHAGFMKALGMQTDGWPKEIEMSENRPYAYYLVRERLREILQKNPKAKFIATGHSLGGALAVIFPVILKYHGEDELLARMEGVYTFGQPRVGDAALGRYAEELLDSTTRRYFRFVYNNDIVTRVPFDDNVFQFTHFGRCIYFDSLYRARDMNEEPNENYFDPRYTIPKQMDAMWELYRSFIIGYWKGQEYEESMVMKMMRAMGMMMPGLPNHSPQDYNNITRLGSLMGDPNTPDY